MNEKIVITVLIFLFSVSVIYSQNYYWYKGKQLGLQIDITKLNVTIAKHGEIELDLLVFLDKYSKSLKLNQLEETYNKKLFSIELESSQMYNDIVTLLKSNSNIDAVSPYFIRGEVSSIGTSSFFYVQIDQTAHEITNRAMA